MTGNLRIFIAAAQKQYGYTPQYVLSDGVICGGCTATPAGCSADYQQRNI